MSVFKEIFFVRVQSAVWMVFIGISVLYQMFLIFLLSKSKLDAKNFKYISSSLGVPFPERSYAENCALEWDVIRNQLDGFVVAHIVGWYLKALLFRDYWICWIMSIMFEVMEYSLQHQLPNFAECWWDHWILDVVFCNGIGIYLGMKTCQYFKIEEYCWKGVEQVSPEKRKNARFLPQFISSSCNLFNWEPERSFKHYVVVLLVISTTLQCELNVFYLKYLFWIPPEHYLTKLRLLIIAFMCAPCVQEIYYYYYIGMKYKKLSAYTYFIVAIIWTESIICFKFSKEAFPNPASTTLKVFWSILIALLIIYPIMKFNMIKKMNIKQRTD